MQYVCKGYSIILYNLLKLSYLFLIVYITIEILWAMALAMQTIEIHHYFHGNRQIEIQKKLVHGWWMILVLVTFLYTFYLINYILTKM